MKPNVGKVNGTTEIGGYQLGSKNYVRGLGYSPASGPPVGSTSDMMGTFFGDPVYKLLPRLKPDGSPKLEQKIYGKKGFGKKPRRSTKKGKRAKGTKKPKRRAKSGRRTSKKKKSKAFGNLPKSTFTNNLSGLPRPGFPDMRAFPQPGGLAREVGAGTTPGGDGYLSAGSPYPGLPVVYWWGFGQKGKKAKATRSKKKGPTKKKKNPTKKPRTKSKKRSKKKSPRRRRKSKAVKRKVPSKTKSVRKRRKSKSKFGSCPTCGRGGIPARLGTGGARPSRPMVRAPVVGRKFGKKKRKKSSLKKSFGGIFGTKKEYSSTTKKAAKLNLCQHKPDKKPDTSLEADIWDEWSKKDDAKKKDFCNEAEKDFLSEFKDNGDLFEECAPQITGKEVKEEVKDPPPPPMELKFGEEKKVSFADDILPDPPSVPEVKGIKEIPEVDKDAPVGDTLKEMNEKHDILNVDW